jgi:ATP-dependent protease HslVU (ClpYQ) peptidase subunit
MNKTLDTQADKIRRVVEIEEQLFTLAGETGEAWRLIEELSRLNFSVGLVAGGANS